MQKNTIRPYVSIDLETTGVNIDNVHILEIGAVIEDGSSKYEDLDTLGIMIKEDKYDYSEPFAMQMNKDILTEIATAKWDMPNRKYHDAEDGTAIKRMYPAFMELQRFIEQASELALAWDLKNNVARPSSSVSLAGKNVAGFDLPIILNNIRKMRDASPGNVKGCESLLAMLDTSSKSSLIKRRVIDPGPMFLSDFGYVPSLGEINTLTGETYVAHRAVADAMQVVKAVRWNFYRNN